jgi:hypothetical protein
MITNNAEGNLRKTQQPRGFSWLLLRSGWRQNSSNQNPIGNNVGRTCYFKVKGLKVRRTLD